MFQLALRQQLAPLCERLPVGALASFGRVLLEDSTQGRFHEKLAEAFQGSGGRASRSAVKIDLIAAVMHPTRVEVHRSDGRAADQGRALALVPPLQANDVVVRDLGDVSLESLRQIDAHGAWYLSRFSTGVEVSLESAAQADALVVVDYLQQHYPDDAVIDLPVYLGQERLSCRLLAYRLPDDVVQQRRRNAVAGARKQGRVLTQEYRHGLACGFSVTNVSQQVWSSNVVGTVYRLRWHVEFTLKPWQSLLHIHVLKGTRPERIQCILYGRLIPITMITLISS